MSRRAAIVEEFDDDTDLPLPNHPLPNTGSRGPLLQEMHISDDEFEPPRAGPASLPRTLPTQGRSESGSRPSQANASHQVTDTTPYKSWSCIYPIYIDAKRPYGTGQRRVERAKSVWWPLSKDIADAAGRLGLATLHEVNKSHPRDWENPGRVRVQWKKDGKLMNPVIKTKKHLLEMICLQLHTLKPENVPKPPYNTGGTIKIDAPPPTITATTANEPATPAPSLNKGKQPAATKSKSPAAPPHHPPGRQVPVPPEPYPPLASRISPYSPSISTGVLIETVKAGMNSAEPSAIGAAPGAPGAPGGAGKGKRKVVRVRG